MRVLTIITLFSLVAGTALSAADVSSIRGLDATGRTEDWSRGLREPKAGKKLWSSPEPNLGVGWGIASGPSNKARDMTYSSRYGGPMVANGKVFMVYYKPSGSVIDEKTMAKAKDKRPLAWSVLATDVCVCRDADSGKILWRAEFPDQGLNRNYERHSPWIYPVAVDGEVAPRTWTPF